MNGKHYVFKVILVGNSGVGKTSILKYMNNGTHVDPRNTVNVPTIGIDFLTKNFKRHDHTVKLQIWDTSGQERFKCITKSYFRGSATCLLVFSLADRLTFLAIEQWHQLYLDNGGTGKIILVGSKHDLERVVTPEEIKRLCETYNFKYTETSAVSGMGIVTLFQMITQLMLDDLSNQYKDCETTSSLRVDTEDNKQAGFHIKTIRIMPNKCQWVPSCLGYQKNQNRN